MASGNMRLAKDERRQQLLETAFDIVRRDGSAALTLAVVAEHAGVTKPIAYEHFGTRADLLLALDRHCHERGHQALIAAGAAGGRDPRETAERIAAAHVDQALVAGPASEEVAAALYAYEQTRDAVQASRRERAAAYAKAFAGVGIAEAQREALFSGILGASEALAREAACGRITREMAIAAIVRITLGAIGAGAA